MYPNQRTFVSFVIVLVFLLDGVKMIKYHSKDLRMNISKENPLFITDVQGHISPKAYQFNPNEFVYEVSQNVDPKSACSIKIVYISSQNMRLVKRKNEKNNSKILKDGDYFLYLKKGENVLSETLIGKKDKYVCDKIKDVHIKGVQQMIQQIKKERVHIDTKDFLKTDTWFRIPLYEYKLKEPNLQNLKKILSFQKSSVTHDINELMKDLSEMKIDSITSARTVAAYKKEINISYASFSEHLLSFCNKYDLLHGKPFHVLCGSK
jgi:hypothetical protein